MDEYREDKRALINWGLNIVALLAIVAIPLWSLIGAGSLVIVVAMAVVIVTGIRAWVSKRRRELREVIKWEKI